MLNNVLGAQANPQILCPVDKISMLVERVGTYKKITAII